MSLTECREAVIPETQMGTDFLKRSKKNFIPLANGTGKERPSERKLLDSNCSSPANFNEKNVINKH